MFAKPCLRIHIAAAGVLLFYFPKPPPFFLSCLLISPFLICPGRRLSSWNSISGCF